MCFMCNSWQFQVQLSSLDTTFVWLWWETSTPRNWKLLWIANLDVTEQTLRKLKNISKNSSECCLSLIHHCQHCHQSGHKSCITALAIKQTPIFWWWWWCNACIQRIQCIQCKRSIGQLQCFKQATSGALWWKPKKQEEQEKLKCELLKIFQ